MVAKRAIPLIVGETNGVKRSEGATQKFYLMVGDPDIVHPFLDVLDVDITDGDSGKLS